ncbi:Cd2+/Zn2+-exporting ATPase [Hazenella coriacea]|uniref:Cd(2+)-exporting ATPase n=1 Tax=Hazenella coriacea TaxID=1179467 RepID=A0A4R3L3P8_9BACL|nr:Cd2+/Zn2+-exporting ATPase [Hazenella coriacea]
MSEQTNRQVYRVHGFTCAGCAKTFEENVKSLPGVNDAEVNFGASKITVYGEATVSELEKAGAFEKLKLSSELQGTIQQEPFWKKKEHLFIVGSFLLLIFGWFSSFRNGEESLITITLYLSSMLLGGTRLFIQGLRNLVRFKFDMRTLMTIAIIGAAIIGEWSEGATVVILFAISEVLESYSMERARRSIHSMMDLAPQQALVRREGKEVMIPVREVNVGDILLIKPGQKIAMDGEVLHGHSSINQAAITGESLPVYKTVGNEVFAGTLNEEGYLEVKVTKRVEDTTLAKMIHLVEEAQAHRAPSQAFVDRFAEWYTPAILILSLLFMTVPPLILGAEWGEWIYRGLALLVVGCPCALIISTPVAIVTAIGNAARHGVLIKGGLHLEEAAHLQAFAFDKTGTLTHGTPNVTDFIALSSEQQRTYLEIATAIERNSQHPLATALYRKAELEGVSESRLQVEEFSSVIGKGVEAKVDGTFYMIGKPTWFEELQVSLSPDFYTKIQDLQKQGKTVMLFGTKNQVLAIIAVQDTLRAESISAIQELHHLGIQPTVLLTGDHQVTATTLGKQLGISEIYAELLPKDKLERIREVQQKGKNVAMVGDGVNDAPALATANIGIAMGGAGTDTALETADLVIMGDDLSKLPFVVRLSRKAMQIIKQNVTFSIGIKVLAFLLILPGWLTLWMAVFADMGATLIVTLNGLRLLQVRQNK